MVEIRRPASAPWTDYDSRPLPSFPRLSTSTPLQCRQDAYDQVAEWRFAFLLLWGSLVFLLYTVRRVNCRRFGIEAVGEVSWGEGKRTLTKASSPLRAATADGNRRRGPFAPPGQGSSNPRLRDKSGGAVNQQRCQWTGNFGLDGSRQCDLFKNTRQKLDMADLDQVMDRPVSAMTSRTS